MKFIHVGLTYFEGVQSNVTNSTKMQTQFKARGTLQRGPKKEKNVASLLCVATVIDGASMPRVDSLDLRRLRCHFQTPCGEHAAL